MTAPARAALYMAGGSTLTTCARHAERAGLRVVTMIDEDRPGVGLAGARLNGLVDRLGDGEFEVIVADAGAGRVVTIAAVFVIPASVPHHDVLVLIALVAVLGTLYLQGLTLPWLTRVLRVVPNDPAADALARATLLQKAADAGNTVLASCEQQDDPAVVRMIRDRQDQRTFAAWERLSTQVGQESPEGTDILVTMNVVPRPAREPAFVSSFPMHWSSKPCATYVTV